MTSNYGTECPSCGSTRSLVHTASLDNRGHRIRLRHWQPGDLFRPIGMSGQAKLQDILTNKKIPLEQRRALVVAGGGLAFAEAHETVDGHAGPGGPQLAPTSDAVDIHGYFLSR